MNEGRQEVTHLAILGHERREEADLEIHEFRATVPADLRWFRGHFDENPVLAAVVQLQEALLLTREKWPDLGSLRRIQRAKFHRRILPSDSLRLRLERAHGAGRARFFFSRGDDKCSSATLIFEPTGDRRE